jgi:hypothetical protein
MSFGHGRLAFVLFVLIFRISKNGFHNGTTIEDAFPSG